LRSPADSPIQRICAGYFDAARVKAPPLGEKQITTNAHESLAAAPPLRRPIWLHPSMQMCRVICPITLIWKRSEEMPVISANALHVNYDIKLGSLANQRQSTET
jgi:hypothetical protein